MYEKVYRAGLIPYLLDDGEVRMMFMLPSDTTYGGAEFQIAKGRVDPGEHHLEAAIREAKEELGLLVSNIVGEVLHVGRVLGRTDLYVARVSEEDMFGLPANETEETRWMTLDEFMLEGRPLHQPVVQSAYREIARHEGLEIPLYKGI